ncbi:glycerophosphodiester phosphodiesterase [Mangrovihabitans endophyticus]|uniref:Glycerophosphoryl diester phosphodiesterase n=1 Tax=Mangrovihabitans endophyticus TaxID=1751298 RepID=A0A8J3C8E5_9ACTN|nr:glycerophosphodiester phosphodiesterase family protein [Mangrovihabitans endophyticus]GGL18721.1 glycerophosphoryl diester phosphodiesterase [Mangrovihabitans endophyticus]
MAVHNVAHRGYSAVAPENTLPALDAAVLAGASLIEFDVRTTADGVPVVIHDRTVDRTTSGIGEVGELTWAQIHELDAGSWFSAAYAGARVPLLADVLSLLCAPRAQKPAPERPVPPAEAPDEIADPPPAPPSPELLLEIKSPATAEQVEAILGMVGEAGLLERTVVQSFDPDVVRLAAEAVPQVRRGLLRFDFDADQLAVAKDLGLTFCNPSINGLLSDRPTLTRLADAGVGVMPWTANDPAQWPQLIEAGVAGLITDRAGELTGWAAARA